jgi:hypothetical protein
VKPFAAILSALFLMIGAIELGLEAHVGEAHVTKMGSGPSRRVLLIGDSTALPLADPLQRRLTEIGVPASVNTYFYALAGGIPSTLFDDLARKPADLAVVFLSQRTADPVNKAKAIWQPALGRILRQAWSGWKFDAHLRWNSLLTTPIFPGRGAGCATRDELAYLSGAQLELFVASLTYSELGETLRVLDRVLIRCGGDPEVQAALATIYFAELRPVVGELFLERARARLAASAPALRLAEAARAAGAASGEKLVAIAEEDPVSFLAQPAARALLYRVFFSSVDLPILLPSAVRDSLRPRVLALFTRAGFAAPGDPRENADPVRQRMWGQREIEANYAAAEKLYGLLAREFPASRHYAQGLVWALQVRHRRPDAEINQAVEHLLQVDPDNFQALSSFLWSALSVGENGKVAPAESGRRIQLLDELIQREPGLERLREARNILRELSQGCPARHESQCWLQLGAWMNGQLQAINRSAGPPMPADLCGEYRTIFNLLDASRVPWVISVNPQLPLSVAYTCLKGKDASRAFDSQAALFRHGDPPSFFRADREHLTAAGADVLGEELAVWLKLSIL